MNSELLIPWKLKTWREDFPRVRELMDSPYGDALMEAYENLRVDALFRSDGHGVGHIERAMLFGALIAQNEKLDEEMTHLLLLCCSYHDVGRTDDRYDLEHGKKSAEKIERGELRTLFSRPKLAEAAIHAHAIPDSEMASVRALYGNPDEEDYLLLTRCLKDADNLDRVRLYDLDVRFLRFPGSRAMGELAYDLYEDYERRVNVLCFGDSNTYGYNSKTGRRLPPYLRWTTSLQRYLGCRYNVINEGLNGRTTAFTKAGSVWKSGLYEIEPILARNDFTDILIIMLGTNDCAAEIGLDENGIADGMERLVTRAKEYLLLNQGYLPRILLVAPPAVQPGVMEGPFSDEFNDRQLQVSAALPAALKNVAEKMDCEFVDLSGQFVFWDIDCEHFQPKDHFRVAKTIAGVIAPEQFEEE